MVDARPLEGLKENISVLPEGRLVSSRDTEQGCSLQDDVRHVNYSNEDPLGHWLKRLATHESIPMRTRLLSEITSKFADSDVYRNDMRYLRTWLEYATLSPDPLQIFRWMVQRGIGSCRALFYEEYSAYLESRKLPNRAEEVLEAGMKAGALPVARLKLRLDELKERIQFSNDKDENVSMLLQAPLSGLEAKRQRPGREQPETQSTNAPKRLRIFNDEANDQVADESLHAAPNQPFPAIPIQDENKQQASQWIGQTIPQKNVQSISTGEQHVDVFRDNDTEHVMVLLDSIWPDGPDGDEMSYEEIMLKQRNLINLDIPRKYDAEVKNEAEEDRTERLNAVLHQYHYGNAHLGYTEAIAPSRAPEPTEVIPRVPLQNQKAIQPPQWPPRQDSTWSNGSRSHSSGSSISQETQPSAPPTPNVSAIPGKNSLRISPQLQALLVSRSSGDHAEIKVDVEGGNPPGPPGPPCDASLPEVRRNMLARILRALQRLPLFIHSPMLLPLAEMKPGSLVELAHFAARLKRQLGDGNYGVVWKARLEQGKMFALKAERSTIPWEFYLICVARSRLRDQRVLDSIVSVYHYEGYAQIQFMLMSLMGYGTLLDVSNVVHHGRFANDRAHEQLTMFYMVELLRTIENLHNVGIIHGDVKPENIMIRVGFDPSSRRLRGEYQPSGERGWRDHGICLVDFGRGIDTRLFPLGQQFIATWDADPEQDCWEVRHHQPWSYETDYHGIASVAHALLFGPRLVVRQTPEGRQPSPTSARRQPRHPVWRKMFQKMLNPVPSLTEMLSNMSSLRREMEVFLEDPPLEEGNLRSLYAGVANHLRGRKT